MKEFRNIVTIALIAFSLGFCNQSQAIPERNVIELLDSGAGFSILGPGGKIAAKVFNYALEQDAACITASSVSVHAWLKTYFYKKEKTFKQWIIYFSKKADTYLFIPHNADMEKIKTGFAIEDASVLQKIHSIKQLEKNVSGWNGCRWKWCNILKLIWWYAKKSFNWNAYKKIYKPESEGWIFCHGAHSHFMGQRYRENRNIGWFDYLTIPNITNRFSTLTGLKINDALDRIKFLGSTIKTLGAFELSCFSGGHYAKMVLKKLHELENKNDFSSYLYAVFSLSDTNVPPIESEINYESFFTTIRKIFDSDNTPKAQLFKDALTHVYNENNYPIDSTVMLRVPGMNSFAPTTNLNKIKIIKSESTEKCTLDNFATKALALYPAKIKLTFDFPYYAIPKIVSMILGNGSHEIEKISLKISSFENFVSHAFFSFPETSNKIFLIKTLEEKYFGKIYNNVIIEKVTQPELLGFSPFVTTVSGSIYFENNGEHFCGLIKSSQFKRDHESATPFKKISKHEFEQRLEGAKKRINDEPINEYGNWEQALENFIKNQ